MKHRFYVDDRLLFGLEAAAEYDTATPYRYAVSRFVNVANLLRLGVSVTVISQGNLEERVTLRTVDELRHWLSLHFSGFEQYVP